MKLSCQVIQDLLPLYFDRVCSEESRKLVQEHLCQCEDCSALLDALKGEIDAPYDTADEVKPLKSIQKAIRKGKRRALSRGMLASVALILVAALLCSGIWYSNIGKYYDQIADKMKPVTIQMSSMTAATHYLEDGMYGVILQKPFLFSDAGFIRVGDRGRTVGLLQGEYDTVNPRVDAVYIDLFFYPKQGGGYKFALSFEARNRDIPDWVWVNPDLSPDMEEEFYDLEEQLEYTKLLNEYRLEIEELFNVVEAQFGISYLQ